MVHAPNHTIYFYRDQQGREVDFLVQGGGGFSLIECKWAELPSERDAKWLHYVGDLLLGAQPEPLFVRRSSLAGHPPPFRYGMEPW